PGVLLQPLGHLSAPAPASCLPWRGRTGPAILAFLGLCRQGTSARRRRFGIGGQGRGRAWHGARYGGSPCSAFPQPALRPQARRPPPPAWQNGAMSYLVLARKWRPKRFAELVGQEHVVRALVNALDSGRVHH